MIKLPTANNKYLDTKLGHQLGTDLKLHDGVIIAFLADNHFIRSAKKDEDEKTKMGRYSFVMEEKSVLYHNDYIRKIAKTIPVSELMDFTDLRSSEDSDEQVVAFLPVTFRLYNAKCRSYRITLEHILKVCMDMDFMCMKIPLGVYLLDEAIDNLFQLEKQFWDKINMSIDAYDRRVKNVNQANEAQAWLLGRRIKNKTYSHVKDYNDIIKHIQDAEFTNQNNSWYSAGVQPKETFEKSSHFQVWKDSMGFKPLDPSRYQKYLTYTQTATLFQSLHLHPEVFIKLCGLFLSSYHLCHLIIHGGIENGENWIIKKFSQFMASEEYNSFWEKAFDGYYVTHKSNDHEGRKVNLGGQNIFHKMSTILYFEERLLASTITKQHRCLVPISFASSLPRVYNLKDSHHDVGPGGYSFRETRPEQLNFWHHQCTNFYYPLPILGQMAYNIPLDLRNDLHKICNYDIFLLRFQLLSAGMLEGLDWSGLGIYFTGAGAEMCYYQNGYFPFEFLISEHKDNPYLNSDLDLGVHIQIKDVEDANRLELSGGSSDNGSGSGSSSDNKNPQDDDDHVTTLRNDDPRVKKILKERAETILEVVKQNYGLEDLKLLSRNSRWIIKHPDLPREIDIFSFTEDPGALVYNYHMATCRVVAQPIEKNSDDSVHMLSSACLSAMIGSCIDRRWFTSKKSIHNRIMKHLNRGIGLMMNPNELAVITQYIYDYQKKHPSEVTVLLDLPRHLEINDQVPPSRFIHMQRFFQQGDPRALLFMNHGEITQRISQNKGHAELASLINLKLL